jgi:hypothetical protein
MSRWREKAAAEQAAEQPQQTTQPGNEPSPPRTVEHGLLCAKQLFPYSTALCDCKGKKR